MSSERRTDVALVHKKSPTCMQVRDMGQIPRNDSNAQTGGQSMEGAYQMLTRGKAPQRAEIAWR